jgi:chromate reductase, NAD(P)H dehydrogenase (quinone)
MRSPKILVFAGSIRTASFNARLAGLAARELALLNVDVTRISLLDYPLPLFHGDLEAEQGAPVNAVKLKRMLGVHHGVFIASPEYNASITPLLKNTLDWISRVREGAEPPLAAYRRVFALGAASNGTYGGYRSLMALRQVLELGCGAAGTDRRFRGCHRLRRDGQPARGTPYAKTAFGAAAARGIRPALCVILRGGADARVT